MALKKFNLPDLGEGVTEGEILKIKVKEGDTIALDQVLLEVMTDKASMEVPSSIEGVIEKISVKEGDIVSVGKELFSVQTKDSNKEPEDKIKKELTKNERVSAEIKTSAKDTIEKKEDIKSLDLKTFPLAIPSSRKLAQELGIDLGKVRGSGEKGKIKREDILNHIKQEMSSSSLKPSAPLLADFEESKRISLKGIQRLMFESMTLSKASIPHFTIGEQAQVDHLVGLRTEMKARLEKKGLKIGYLPFLIKALVPTIKEFPIFNSVYDSSLQEIVFKKQINFGFAVDSPQGLIVPVIKQADKKSLLEITKELFELSEKTRAGTIEREHLKGSGFSLTNLGSLGGMYGTPIIQAPEMAILGIYKIFKKVIKNNKGEFEEKSFMNFSITCDHRFIDGATAMRFLKSFVQKVEEPSLLLLEE